MTRSGQFRAAAGMALLALLWLYTPPAEPRWHLCGFQWLTGRPCPLCGITRGLFALAKGHWSQAIGFHALSPLAAAMLAGLFWNGVPGRLWTAGLAAFGIYGAWRIFA